MCFSFPTNGIFFFVEKNFKPEIELFLHLLLKFDIDQELVKLDLQNDIKFSETQCECLCAYIISFGILLNVLNIGQSCYVLYNILLYSLVSFRFAYLKNGKWPEIDWHKLSLWM